VNPFPDQSESARECGAIHEEAHAVCTLPAGHEGDHANRHGYWMPRPGEHDRPAFDEEQA
jgi:hypothetical protein